MSETTSEDLAANPGEAAGAEESSRRASMFAALRERRFASLTLGTLSANYAQWANTVGGGWLVYDLTGSAGHLGAVAFAGGITTILVTPLAGVMADRTSRANLIVWSAIVSVLLSLLTAGLAMTGTITIWYIYVMSVAGSFVNTVGLPARQALVHDAAPEGTLADAVAINSLVQNLSRLSGPPLFGLLAAWATASPFIAIAILRAVDALAMVPLRCIRQDRPKAPTSPYGDLIRGVRYVFSDRVLSSLFLIVFGLSLAAYGYLSFLPVFSEEVLGAGAMGFGLLLATGGFGQVVGVLAFTRFVRAERRGPAMLACFAIHLGCIAVFTQVTNLPAAMAILATGGVFLGVAYTLYYTLFQLHTRDEFRGRALSLGQCAAYFLIVSPLAMGLTIALVGVQGGMLVHVVAGAAILAAVAVLRPGWRQV